MSGDEAGEFGDQRMAEKPETTVSCGARKKVEGGWETKTRGKDAMRPEAAWPSRRQPARQLRLEPKTARPPLSMSLAILRMLVQLHDIYCWRYRVPTLPPSWPD